ncbi:MAG: HDIG domain-containing protein [Deltaproteobacteria bacterium]|jgi:putative nucleotidyltransferase with HDIG domain|nr:HDIG domain-containing protein [Deltaproteobacteria bacterium]
MSSPAVDREAALNRLKEQKPDSNQMQHALNSEAIMRALAARLGEDQDRWGVCGLLHDVDYPHTMNDHPNHGLMAIGLLQGLPGVDEAMVNAIVAHNSEFSGKEPVSTLDYALRAAETMTGLVYAASLMRPTGMVGMEVKSLKKKFKDKAFAANCRRDRIQECEKCGLSLDEFMDISIKAMS